MNYKVIEKFISINGEGLYAGELAVFIRLATCNLRCRYCDTAWSYDDADATEMSSDEIIEYIKGTGVKRVTLTGGEPLLGENSSDLVKEICSMDGTSLEIETNGSINLEELVKFRNEEEKNNLSFTVDYKLPGSYMEAKMDLKNYGIIDKNDVVKFVVSTKEDLNKTLQIINMFELSEKTNVYISPSYLDITGEDIVEFMKDNNMNGIKMQLQLHKYIWNPEEKGV